MPKFISKNKKKKSKLSYFNKNKNIEKQDESNKKNALDPENNNSKKQNSFFSKLKYLDPFTYVDLYVMPIVKSKTDSKLVENIVNVIFAAIFAGIVYLLLGLLFGTASPLVIVYSASMETTFYRGDVMALGAVNNEMDFGKEINLEYSLKDTPTYLFATPVYQNGQIEKIVFNDGQEIIPNQDGQVIVYNSFPQKLPIIHRTIARINAIDGAFLLTKGDNAETNPTFDQDCGKIDFLRQTVEKPCVSFYAIPIEEVQGVSFARVPLIGCVKLWLFDDLFSLITTGKLPRDFKGIC